MARNSRQRSCLPGMHGYVNDADRGPVCNLPGKTAFSFVTGPKAIRCGCDYVRATIIG